MKKILLGGLVAMAFGSIVTARAGVSVHVGLPMVSVQVGIPAPAYVAPAPVYVRTAPPVYVAPAPVIVASPSVIYARPVYAAPVVYVPRHHHHRWHVAFPVPPFCR